MYEIGYSIKLPCSILSAPDSPHALTCNSNFSSHDILIQSHDLQSHVQILQPGITCSTAETKIRLSTCWETDINWDLYPIKVKEVI